MLNIVCETTICTSENGSVCSRKISCRSTYCERTSCDSTHGPDRFDLAPESLIPHICEGIII